MLRVVRPIIGEQSKRGTILKARKFFIDQREPARGICANVVHANFITVIHQASVAGARQRKDRVVVVAIA